MKEYCDSCEEYIDQVDLGDGEFGCPLCRKTNITTFYKEEDCPIEDLNEDEIKEKIEW
jgi:predicted RNA-binding Zn-ribbon protein involved in translation (DUF1610 family)